MRLKNMTLSYNLSKELIQKIKLQGARIYASGANLLTITGLYFDPEVSTGGKSEFRVPPMKTITFGVEISF